MQTPLAESVIGLPVTDSEARRLGRVVAIIHKRDGVDVLVEGHRWVRRRTYRFSADDLTATEAGVLVHLPRSVSPDRTDAMSWWPKRAEEGDRSWAAGVWFDAVRVPSGRGVDGASPWGVPESSRPGPHSPPDTR
jgi:hypothetical protein